MIKVLVTGGAGFIGSCFIRYMLSEYDDVEIINLDALTYAGSPDNLKDISHMKNYRFIKGDIADRGLVDDIFRQGLNYVVNFCSINRAICTAYHQYKSYHRIFL
jgi:dTDP-glucose 4,6-dehydratase